MLKVFWAWIPVVVVFTIFILLGCLPAMILSLLGARKSADRWCFAVAFRVYAFLAWILGARVHVEGDVEELRKLQNEGRGLCFISNHSSLFDIPLTIGAGSLRMGFVAKKELAWVPLVNILAVSFHSVFIDRHNLKKGVRSIRRGAEKISRYGYSLLIFPEGTRSKNGEIAPFKHGSFRLATESGAPIVPVAIKGDRELVESRRSCNPFRRTDVWISYLPPVETKGLDRNAVAEVERKVEEDIRQAYSRLGR